MTTPTYTPAGTLPKQYRMRRFQREDIPAIVRLINRYAEALQDPDRTDAADLESYYYAPDFNIEEDLWIITNADGALVAKAEIEWGSVENGRNWGNAMIDPAVNDPDLLAYLVEMTDQNMRDRAAAKFPGGQALSVERYSTPTETVPTEYYLSVGYRYVRSYYHMGVNLTTLGEIEPLALPDGLEVRPVTPEQLPQIHQSFSEAFEDHWGWAKRPYEEWKHYAVDGPGADTGLWRIAWDGDQIASVAINRPFGEEVPHKGWISTIGTRRQWRRKGLAFMLLRESFRVLRDAGFTWAGLGVDSASLTNAVALYERAGMHVEIRYDGYAKMIRGEWLPIYPQA